MQHIRDELQSTVEELQTSNEELKASHEEVVSVNEELQSANEELETGREEMQSLNEELTTVNSQLQAKMEEHQAARNDLASLLTSTDIAVLFLDTKFNIRRFTPAVRDLLELIPGDVGRPLSDLARKFNDPDLVRDCQAVLERLLPVEREIAGEGQHWYLRRALPYRTADDHIDGVVITFLDITHRKQAEAERLDLLRREQGARAEAEAANRVKDEFLAMVSHELRTPLSAILLWAKMLEDKPHDPAQLKEGLISIRNSAESQRELIEDLLDTSRIIAGKLRLSLRAVDMRAMVHNAIDAVLPTANARHIVLQAKLNDNVGMVTADGSRLQQVVWNLLSNAVKFTPADGRIELTMNRIGDEVDINVTDTGCGIEADFLPRVFDRFRQADSSTARAQSGLGLGLAISKQLVESHGGTIEARSRGRDQGATFIVRLPLPELTESDGASPGAGSRVGSAAPDLTGLEILVVEDDTDTRKALAALMQFADARVVAVDSAEAAMKAFQQSRPALIISDIGLPAEDGYSLIRRLRAWETAHQIPRVPAIALTAFARDKDRQAALEAGFGAHLVKPVDADALFATVQRVLTKR